MNVRRTATTAAAAALSLLVLGGTAYALGTDDTPTGTAATATATSAPAPADDRIPVDRAREIAVAAVGGGEVTKVESEVEHGRPQWKVDVSSGDDKSDDRARNTDDNPRHDASDDRGGDDHGHGHAGRH